MLGPDVSRLYERLGNAASFTLRVKMLNAFFLERLQRAPTYPALLHGFRPLLTGGQNAGVTRIAKQIGMSTRQLERKSLEYFGLPPVMLSRIARFQKALAIGTSKNTTWLEVAHAAEYYDQMHMVRDFRAFAGVSPTKALASIEPHHLINM